MKLVIRVFHSYSDSNAAPAIEDLELAHEADVFNFIASMHDKREILNSFRYEGKNFSRIKIREINE